MALCPLGTDGSYKSYDSILKPIKEEGGEDLSMAPAMEKYSVDGDE